MIQAAHNRVIGDNPATLQDKLQEVHLVSRTEMVLIMSLTLEPGVQALILSVHRDAVVPDSLHHHRGKRSRHLHQDPFPLDCLEGLTLPLLALPLEMVHQHQMVRGTLQCLVSPDLHSLLRLQHPPIILAVLNFPVVEAQVRPLLLLLIPLALFQGYSQGHQVQSTKQDQAPNLPPLSIMAIHLLDQSFLSRIQSVLLLIQPNQGIRDHPQQWACLYHLPRPRCVITIVQAMSKA